MNFSFLDSDLSADLVGAIERKGYELLTPIQQAVLEVDSTTKDLRITSITGSGKTLAIGFALRDIAPPEASQSRKGPRGLILVPTRELAKQVQTELRWLFEERQWRVESVTGGTSIRDERRALSVRPMVLVATPGRLLDHLRHGAFVVDEIATVVLDEADRMLDMGFQDDLQAILEALPQQRRTHMASATFGDGVGRLANRYQRDPVHVQGTPLGQANEDIEHVVHLVHAEQKLDAIVNLLLDGPEEQSILFARTRADVASIARELGRTGFAVASLSGEMEQPARDRALATFRRGATRVLVATDVAARGLDIQSVTQIIHVDPPTDSDGYVHRSGRTGRAGHKGTSRVLVVPAGVGFVKMLMRRAGIKFRVMPIPTAEKISATRDEQLLVELTQPQQQTSAMPDARHRAMAARLCAAADPVELVSRLLTRIESKGIAPRIVHSPRIEEGGHAQAASRQERALNPRKPKRLPATSRPGKPENVYKRAQNWQPGADSAITEPGFGAFHVTWGEDQGADARRLLAIVCRKGRIRSKDVGAIRIGATSSVIEVRTEVAAAFAKAAKTRDRRDPLVCIAPLR